MLILRQGALPMGLEHKVVILTNDERRALKRSARKRALLLGFSLDEWDSRRSSDEVAADLKMVFSYDGIAPTTPRQRELQAVWNRDDPLQ